MRMSNNNSSNKNGNGSSSSISGVLLKMIIILFDILSPAGHHCVCRLLRLTKARSLRVCFKDALWRNSRKNDIYSQYPRRLKV